MKKEIEIPFEVQENVEKGAMLLKRFGAKSTGTERVVDTYFYNTMTGQFLPDDEGVYRESLRIRQTDVASYYTYKNDVFLPNGEWSHSDEYELKIEDAGVLEAAMLKQGYHKLITIDMKKTKFQWSDFEIAFEEVKQLGVFVEIEYTGEEGGRVEDIKARIRQLISDIGFTVQSEITAGKPELLIAKLGLTFTGAQVSHA